MRAAFAVFLASVIILGLASLAFILLYNAIVYLNNYFN